MESRRRLNRPGNFSFIPSSPSVLLLDPTTQFSPKIAHHALIYGVSHVDQINEERAIPSLPKKRGQNTVGGSGGGGSHGYNEDDEEGRNSMI